MKYIINVPEDRVHDDVLCVLGTMEDGVDHYLPTGIKAIPYDESAAEQRGQEEAWELIKAIGKMSDQEMRECFRDEIIVNLSYTEAREMYEAWKEQKDIKVGDEVERDDKTAVFVVTDITDTNMCAGFSAAGKVRGGYKVHKTGRHFSEIADLLEKMRNRNADH